MARLNQEDRQQDHQATPHIPGQAGVFDHEPPRTFESGSGLWGFLQSVIQGQIKKTSLQRGKLRLALEISDPKGLAKKTGIVIRGLPSGSYKVTQGASSRRVSVEKELTLNVPIQEADHLVIEAT